MTGPTSGLLVHLAKEVHGPVSFTRQIFSNDALPCCEVGLWIRPQTSPSDGLLHSAWALKANRGFLQGRTTKKVGKELIFPRDGPCPRVELPYTYLMAWFALYFPAIIKLGEEPAEDAHFAYLYHLENSQW